MMLPPTGLLSERWRPVHLADVAGNAAAIRDLRRWADGWGPGRRPPRHRAALLEGPPGVGKTTAAWALGRDQGWTVVEMNASDARNRTAIEQVAGRASLTNAFSDDGTFHLAREGGRTLILLDEADCLSGRATEERARERPPPSLREFLQGRYGTVAALASAWGPGPKGAPTPFTRWEDVPNAPGRAGWARWAGPQRDLSEWRGSQTHPDLSDRGGLGAIASLVRSTLQPVILTVNDAQPLLRYSPLFRQNVTRIRFGPVEERELRAILERVAARERIDLQGPAIDAIVHRSMGDVRAALTDLDAITPLPGPAQLAVLGARDHTSDFASFTSEVLAHPRYYRSVEVRDRLDAAPEDLLPWIEEALPRAAVDPTRRWRAFEALGRAELFLARARRTRHFGLWSYASEVMTGGVACALDRPEGLPLPEAPFPGFLIGMGATKLSRQFRRSILSKVGPTIHVSQRKGSELFLPLLFRWFDPNHPGFGRPSTQALRSGIIRQARLTPEEVAFLLGIEPDSDLVARECARAEPPGARPSPPVEEPELVGTGSSEPEAPVARPEAPSEPPTRRRASQRRLAEF